MKFAAMLRRLRNTQGGTRSTARSAYAPTPYAPTPYTDEPPNKLKIVLTFDDGPSTTFTEGVPDKDRPGEYKEVVVNYTRMIMNELERRKITGVFFVQTHVPIRGGSPHGEGVIRETHNRKHILALHTTEPTRPHKSDNEHTALQERGELGNSLQGGIDRIQDITAVKDENDVVVEEGVVVEFVRPPNGEYDTDVIETYERLNLEHVYWDIDPENGDDGTPEGLRANLERQMKRYLPDMKKNPNATPKEQLVALFHDVQSLVGRNIKSLIDKIEEVARNLGYTPCLNLTPDEVKQVMIDQNTENEDVR